MLGEGKDEKHLLPNSELAHSLALLAKTLPQTAPLQQQRQIRNIRGASWGQETSLESCQPRGFPSKVVPKGKQPGNPGKVLLTERDQSSVQSSVPKSPWSGQTCRVAIPTAQKGWLNL